MLERAASPWRGTPPSCPYHHLIACMTSPSACRRSSGNSRWPSPSKVETPVPLIRSESRAQRCGQHPDKGEYAPIGELALQTPPQCTPLKCTILCSICPRTQASFNPYIDVF